MLTNATFLCNASWTLIAPFACFSYKIVLIHKYTKTINSMYTPPFSVFLLVCCFFLLTSLAYIYEYTSFILTYHIYPCIWLTSLANLSAFMPTRARYPFFRLLALLFFKAEHWSINLACLIFLRAYCTKILEFGRNKIPSHFGSWAWYFQYSSSRSFLSLCANNISVSVKL